MVEVHPSHPIVFHYRDLVWATGILNRTRRMDGDDEAAWAMIAAEVNPAAERDISRWFRP
jgi:hypothetical protein